MTTTYKYPTVLTDILIDNRTRVSDEVLSKAFEEFTLETVEEIVRTRGEENSFKALLFYNGDHWQGGIGWIGPQYPTDHLLFSETMLQIRRTFISKNVVSETVDRHVSGVLGRQLHWKLVAKEVPPPIEEPDPITKQPILKPGQPDPSTQALITEGQDALVSWWDKRDVLETLKRAVAGLLCVKRSPLRLSIPPTLRDENGAIPQAATLEEAMDYIYLDHMGWDEEYLEQVMPTATVWTNKSSRESLSLFFYKEWTGEKEAEERAEVSYVDKEGFTVLKVINKDGDVAPAVRLPLGGRILIHEMIRKALISPQVMSQQKSLNKTLTMKDRNDTQGGYLERFFLNVKWPTTEVRNADGTTEEIATPIQTGPGTMNSLQGSSFQDEQGVTHILNPSVQFRDPVPATTFIESSKATYIGMLTEVSQLHHASTDADVSGESRKQSRESYIKDLQSTANPLETAVRWIIETVLAEAAFLSGQVGKFDSLRAYVQAKIDPGPVSPDDMRVAAEMIDRGVWDWETGVSATGVDDVDSIKQRLVTERAENEARMLANHQIQEDLFGDTEEDESEEEAFSG